MIPALKPHFQPFLTLNYEKIENPNSNYNYLMLVTIPFYSKIYESGPKDFLSLFSTTLIWLVIHSALEEYVTDKFLPRMRLSLTKAYECRIAIFSLPFSALGTCYQIFTFYVADKWKNIAAIFVSSPIMKFHTKAAIYIALGYFLSMLIKLHVSKTPA
ncbi:hypothetical protein HZS_7181, partial [Henneguya salminicola]